MTRNKVVSRGALVGAGLVALALVGSTPAGAQLRPYTLAPGERQDLTRLLCVEGTCRSETQKALAAYTPDPMKFPVPRTKWDGKPDFNGVYYPSIVIVRPPVPIASVFLPAVKAKIPSLNRDRDGPGILCYPSVPPRGLGHPHPAQLFHVPGYLAILVESMGTYRVIEIGDGPPKHDPSLKPSFQGDGVGYWDGDTLVVDVTNFNGRGWLVSDPSPLSDALHIVERFTRPDSQILEYTYRVEDPKMLTGPWQGETKRLGVVPYDATDFDPCVGVAETLDLTVKALEKEGVK